MVQIDHNAPLRTVHDLSRVWIQKNNYCMSDMTQGCSKN